MLKKMKDIHNTLTRQISTTYLYQALVRQIKNDRQDEINRHKTTRKLKTTGANQPLNIYADGDSWFDYPIHKDIMGWLGTKAMPNTTILNMAHYGDTSTEIMGLTKRANTAKLWQDPENGKFDAICISMGGNDIVGDQFIMWVEERAVQPNPTEAIMQDRLQDMLYVVESAYNDLIAMRNQLLPDAYIFMHGYDFAVPNGIGVCGLGPWLKPSLEYLGWKDPDEAQLIVTNALLSFSQLLTNIEANHKNVVYVRTQGTLDPQTDWSNELHPTEAGFGKLADKLLLALQTVFPGRI